MPKIEITDDMDEEMMTGGRKKSKMFLALVLIIAAAGIGYVLNSAGLFGNLLSSGNKWQAVFLANNQVYFGHLKHYSGSEDVLTNIFYLRINQTLQPSAQQPNINLVKLGSELHGPEDSMFIPKSQISFWENMRDDSQVVQAIKAFQAQQK